ncbi:MAG TPA: hypothetical protein VFC50_03840 [Candidatus Dormibacteraeota bacterium]|nr:hypothetical protein [Candidatus Dormibacteraeota bacterium]
MRYFVAFFVALGLLFLVVFLLFHSGNKAKTPTAKSLVSYSTTDAQVSMTIDGPVNADQSHQQVIVTVSNQDVTFEQLQGYDGDVIYSQSFANTQNSYAAFLQALAHAGFTLGNNSPYGKDERGYCPLGERYVFQLQQDGQNLERYWTTSCGGKLRTYLGGQILTIDLFQNQVPNYKGLTKTVRF